MTRTVQKRRNGTKMGRNTTKYKFDRVYNWKCDKSEVMGTVDESQIWMNSKMI